MPVTIAVQPPTVSTTAIETELQSFVTLYNKTVEEIQTQLTTKPISNPQNATELATGSLFGDSELTNLLSRMRQTMYEPIVGLAGEMASPSAIGMSTGAPTGHLLPDARSAGCSSSMRRRSPTRLQSNPEGVKRCCRSGRSACSRRSSQIAEPGGSLETRANGDGEQIRSLKTRIGTMNEMLAIRQKALQQTYANLEAAISRNSSQGQWLASQAEQLSKSGI